MKTHIFIIFTLIFSQLTFGQGVSEKKYIIIRQFKGQDKISRPLSNSLNKTVLKFLASLPEYELLLNSAAPPEQTLINIFAVEGVIEQIDNKLSFTLDLLDTKKRLVIKTVKKNEIREEDFIRLIQGGLEALFINLKEENEKAQKLEKKTSNSSDKEIDTISTNTANASAINFKDRIKGLQEGADSAISKKRLDSHSTEENTNQNNNSGASSSGMLMSSSDLDQNDKNDKTIPRIYKRNFNVEVIYEKRNIDTNSYIKTISDLNFLQLRSSGDIWHTENKIFYLKYQGGISKPLASELPAPNLFQYGFTSSFKMKEHSIDIGLKKEDVLFFNITEPGGGLTSGTIQATWAQALIEINPIIKDKKWNIKTQYLSSVASSTGWKPLSKTKGFQGNSTGIEIGLPYIIYGLTPRILYQSTNLAGKGETSLSVKDTRIAIGATYVF
jgi:hypothetical protein